MLYNVLWRGYGVYYEIPMRINSITPIPAK